MKHILMQHSLLVLLLGGGSALLAGSVTIHNDSKEILIIKNAIGTIKATFELLHGKDLIGKPDPGDPGNKEFPLPAGCSLRIKSTEDKLINKGIDLLNPRGLQVAKLLYQESINWVKEPDPRVPKGQGSWQVPVTVLSVMGGSIEVSPGYHVKESKNFDEIHICTDGTPVMHPPGGPALDGSVEEHKGSLQPDDLAG